MSIESNENKNKLERLKEELRKLIEEAKKNALEGKDYDPHLLAINVGSLNEEDAEIWEDYKMGVLAYEKFSKFRAGVISRSENLEAKGIEPNPENIIMHEKARKGEITRDEFLDYWIKEEPSAEFWDYWRKKMTERGEEKTDVSELNFYAYLDNKIEADPKWFKKFAEENKNTKIPKKSADQRLEA